MINKELIESIIAEGYEYIPKIDIVQRSIELEEAGNYVFVGVRQAGKSYTLYRQMQALLQKGVPLENLVYINFDDERLHGMKADQLDLIVQANYSMHDTKPIFFFDEIQNVEGWESFARRLANQKYQVYITGSNAKMLSRDIQTILGGRYLDVWVYPYGFDEFLRANQIELGSRWMYGQKRGEVERAFREYMLWGGFPELIRFKEKRTWLNSLYNRIFFNDLIVRNKIKNEEALRLTLRKLADNICQPVSYNRICNLIKAIGVSCGTATIIEYVGHFKDACLIFSLQNFASRFVERETTKKFYFVDNGLLNLFLTENNAALLENVCAIALYKRFGRELYYYQHNIEVDFYIPEENMAIQVSYSLSDEKTKKRETDALVKLNKIHPLQKAIMLTMSEETTLKVGDIDIAVIPVWKWFLHTQPKPSADT
ncbi:MAG: ATP-binding protein [Marinilabiliaceae bacterium]|nr:ATP-binding protein [Marinilabiliaceae bacterium]